MALSATQANDVRNTFDFLTSYIYQSNVDAGWYTDLETGLEKIRNVMEMLMLIVSEVA